MPTEVIMPKVDMDMATGKIAVWHVAEGDRVEKTAPLFDIETDKAAMEVESPASGTVHHITATVGSEVPIGVPVAWIYAEDEAVGDPPAEAAAPEPVAAPVEASARVPIAAAAAPNGAVRATPAARRAARTAGIDLTEIAGTGPRGRIQRADVEARSAVAAAPATWVAEEGALAIQRSGSGPDIPFVFLHGLAADALGWAALDPHLPTGHPVLKLELPGHGRSPRRRVADFPDLLRQIRQAVDALDLPALHLVGHSLGGALALALADTRPRKVTSLTLLCPAGLGPDIGGPILRGIARAGQPESLGPWLKELTADPNAMSWNYVQAAARMRADPDLRAAQLAMVEALFPDDTQSFDLRAALDRVACPTQIIWGKRDQVIPWRHALAAPGRAALHLFDQVGHMPHLEAPEEIAGILRKAV